MILKIRLEVTKFQTGWTAMEKELILQILGIDKLDDERLYGKTENH